MKDTFEIQIEEIDSGLQKFDSPLLSFPGEFRDLFPIWLILLTEKIQVALMRLTQRILIVVFLLSPAHILSWMGIKFHTNGKKWLDKITQMILLCMLLC